MNTVEEAHLIKQLGSHSLADRLRAWRQLFCNEQDKYYHYFLRRMKNRQDAEDLNHDLYLKVEKRLRDKPLSGRSPMGYIKRMAENLFNDHFRKQKHFERLGEVVAREEDTRQQGVESPSPEKVLERKETRKETGQRIFSSFLSLPEPRDRLLWLLFAAGFKKDEHILSLLPASFKSDRTVRNHRKKTRPYLRQHYEQPIASSAIPNSWKKRLRLIVDKANAYAASCLNGLPQNLAPESQQALCEFFDLKTSEQLAKECFATLNFSNILTPTPQLQIAFFHRENMIQGCLGKQRLYYFGATPVFHKEKVDGVKEELLFFENTTASSISAQLTKLYGNLQGRPIGMRMTISRPGKPVDDRIGLLAPSFWIKSRPRIENLYIQLSIYLKGNTHKPIYILY